MRLIVIAFVILDVSYCYKKMFQQSFFNFKNSSSPYDKLRKGRGMFPTATSYPFFSLAKVLNFFPVGEEVECLANTGLSIARSGICLNPYECKQRSGKASGDCAYGLGVCCVFTVSCGGVVSNNLSYFLSPGFPGAWPGGSECNITIHKVHEGVTQLKIEFIHFNIGQPNRMTGECSEDSFSIVTAAQEFTVCGQNHGQHLYFDLSSEKSVRSEGESSEMATSIVVRTPRDAPSLRLWFVRLIQMPLAYAAPNTCTQYYTEPNGTIMTMNYASNGRHLARQEYRACIARSEGVCGIAYRTCGPFRIGRPVQGYNGPPSMGGPGTGFFGQDGQFAPENQITGDQMSDETQNDDSDVVSNPDNEVDGSGEDSIENNSAKRSINLNRWSPYAQHWNRIEDNSFQYWGYGNYGAGLFGHGRRRCFDRITIPCDSENFISAGVYGQGVCDPHHCGSSFCYPDRTITKSRKSKTKWRNVKKPNKKQNLLKNNDCYVESTATPFAVYIHFGPPEVKGSPEDNLGACLFYQQVRCEGS